jgi:hypothetical protein
MHKEPIMSRQRKTTSKRVVQSIKTGPQPVTTPKTKLGRLESLLRRPEGATIDQIAGTLDWQPHSVRGAISGSLKKKQGLTVVGEKAADGERVYRIVS